MKALNITTLFRKLTKHKNELKRLEESKANAKMKEKLREEKISMSTKASTSKASVKENDESTDDDSSKEEEMSLLANHKRTISSDVVKNYRSSKTSMFI